VGESKVGDLEVDELEYKSKSENLSDKVVVVLVGEEGIDGAMELVPVVVIADENATVQAASFEKGGTVVRVVETKVLVVVVSSAEGNMI